METEKIDSPVHRWGFVAATALAFVVWANAHGGFLVGIAIVALYAGVPPWRWRRWALALACSVAVCINPYGPRLLGYLYRELSAPHPITEWQAVAPGDPGQYVFLLLLAALLLTLPFARTLRRRPWVGVLVATIALMALRHQRHTPLLALCGAVPLAEQLEGASAWVQRRFRFHLSAPAAGTIAAFAAALALLQGSLVLARLASDRFHVVYEAAEYPVNALRFIDAEHLAGNVAVPLDWGGYVLWHGAPRLRVSLDGRFATVYPPAVVAANFDFFAGAGARRAGVVGDRATLVLAPRGAATDAHRDPSWRVLYRDEVAELLTRDPSREPVVGHAAVGRVRFP